MADITQFPIPTKQASGTTAQLNDAIAKRHYHPDPLALQADLNEARAIADLAAIKAATAGERAELGISTANARLLPENIVAGSGISKVISGNNVVLSANGGAGGGIPEAPADGRLYGRKNQAWSEVTGNNASFVSSILQNSKIRMVAHRGMSGLEPENTLPAYASAGKYGYWGAETDIQQTSDGHFIILHDDTVDASTNGTGSVASKTLEQIKALTVDAGNNIGAYPGLTVPTLEEYLLQCKRSNLVPVMEIKTITDNVKLLQILQQHNILDYCLLISFNATILNAIRLLNSTVRLQYLYNSMPNTTEINRVAAIGNADISVQWSATLVTKELVNYCHSLGVKVNIWTIDDLTTEYAVRKLGVDYITSNKLVGGNDLSNMSISSNNRVNSKYYLDKQRNMGKGTGIILGDMEKATIQEVMESTTSAWSDYNGVLTVHKIAGQSIALEYNVQDVKKGDVLYSSARMRRLSGTSPKLSFVSTNMANGVYNSTWLSYTETTVGSEWEFVELTGTVDRDSGGVKLFVGCWTADLDSIYQISDVVCTVRTFRTSHSPDPFMSGEPGYYPPFDNLYEKTKAQKIRIAYTGTVTDPAPYEDLTSDYMPITREGTYGFNASAPLPGNILNQINCCLYDKDKNYLSGVNFESSVSGVTNKIMTIGGNIVIRKTANVAYARVSSRYQQREGATMTFTFLGGPPTYDPSVTDKVLSNITI